MTNVIIERIEIISFGKLKMVQVTPDKGINLLCAPNESGKSTLAAFIKFIFYGYTNTRVQNIIENDKKLYTPWDNPQSEGAVYVITDSGKYKIVRKYIQGGKETLEVFNTKTGKYVSMGVQPGEFFFGVDEQVFEKTAFFKQLTIPTDKDDYLAEQLQNIAMSADEKINTGKALKRLAAAKNMLLGRAKSGLIPKLEFERDELEQSLTEALSVNKQIQELSDKIKESKRLISVNKELLEKLFKEKENIQKYEAFLHLSRIKEMQRSAENAKRNYEQTAKLLLKKEIPSRNIINSLLTLNAEYKSECKTKESVADDIQREEAELEDIKKSSIIDREKSTEIKKQVKSRKTIVVLSTVLTVLFAAGGAVIVWSLIGAALSLVMVLTAMISLKKLIKSNGVKKLRELEMILDGYPVLEQRIEEKKKKIISLNNAFSELVNKTEDMKKRLESGISEYCLLKPSKSYDEQIEFISETTGKIMQMQTVYKTATETLKNATENVDLDLLRAEASGAVRPEREKTKVETELTFYIKKTEIYEKKEREYEGQKRFLEGKSNDPAILIGKRDAVNKKLLELKNKHTALELAISVLEEASDYMKSTVSPKINAYASEFFSGATAGKYKTLSVDTTMAMSYSDELGTKSCDFLSAGTRDSAYLSLRLALIKLLYDKANPPLVLDDAFGRLDDERLKAFIYVLSKTGTDYQTFIFTCGKREQEMLEKEGIGYNIINLNQK